MSVGERWCKVCGGWHSIETGPPDNCRPERNLARSDLPTPRLIRDALDDVWCPADNKIYSSKSAYYGAVKRAGYEIAGDDPSVTQAHERPAPAPKTAPGLKDTLKQAWETHS